MRFSKRNADRKLEARLRAGRPEPSREVTRAIADRVRPRRAGFVHGLRRVPLGLSGGLAAIVLTATIAVAGGGFGLTSTSDSAKSQTAFHRTVVPPPTANQYGNRVTVCILGFVEVRLSRRAALILVRIGIAVNGPCGQSQFPFRFRR